MADQPPFNNRSAQANGVILPEDYYLKNFRYLLTFVESRYQDLLTENEKDYIDAFQFLDENAQRLYVRLTLRKGPFFRSDKLRYSEIDAIDQAAVQLKKSGLFEIYSRDKPIAGNNVEDFLALLSKLELESLLNIYLEIDTPTGQISKHDLLELGAEHLSIDDFRCELQFRVYEPLGTEYLELLKLLFFGNMHQDFTEFVLNDLGVKQYEGYVIDKDTRFFTRREIIDDTMQLYHLSELSYLSIENNDLEVLLQVADMAILINEPSLRRRRDKVVNRIARQLERLDQHHEALRLFSLSASVPARERLARMYHSVFENSEEALLCCERIIAAPEDEAEFEFAAKFGRRILKKSKLTVPDIFPVFEPLSPKLRNLKIEFEQGQRVEETTRRWYESRGYRAMYVENALFTGLFGLVFWDIIFAPIKGVFFNPFQRGPVDLFSPLFRSQREELIAARLLEIEDGGVLSERAFETFDDKRYTANFLVNWQVIDKSLLQLALERIPGKHLLSVFERLLVDLRSNRSGLPDLIVFPDVGGYQLVEVKGPGDKLQANQSRWIRHFEQVKLPYEVVNVQWL